MVLFEREVQPSLPFSRLDLPKVLSCLLAQVMVPSYSVVRLSEPAIRLARQGPLAEYMLQRMALA